VLHVCDPSYLPHKRRVHEASRALSRRIGAEVSERRSAGYPRFDMVLTHCSPDDKRDLRQISALVE
jgi:hypothetical protein